jgi:hypothetical protein
MAVVVPEYQAVAEQIYIAYFGRPADRAGLINMTNLLAAGQAPTSITDMAAAYYSNGAVKSIFDSFGASAESTALYTGTDQQFIVSIYQNVLGRDPLLGGLDFWTNALATHQMTRAEASVQIMAAAMATPADAATIAAKTTVATNFTTAIDTAAEVIGYQGKAAAQTARDMLHSVDGTTDTTEFNATITSTLAALSGTTTIGTSYTLATTVDLINGTSLNDTIIADNTTLNPGDSINGGAGVDTLNFTNSDTNVAGTNFPAANITNVEVLNIRNVGTIVSVDASTITGLTTVNADRSTSAVVVNNVADGAAVGVIGNGTVINGALTANYASDSSTAVINLQNGVNDAANTATVAITSQNTKVVVNSTGADNTIESLALGGAATSLTINATTGFDASTAGITGFGANAGITVTGAGAVYLGALAAAVVTVDASAATGGVSATLGTAVTSFKGSTGNDFVTTAATTATGAVIAAGAGTDILALSAVNDITTAAKGAQYTGFEIIRNSQTTAFDASLIAGVTTLQTSGNGAGFTNMTAAQAAAVTIRGNQTAGTTYSLKDATGTADVLGVTVRGSTAAAVVNAQALTVTGFETLNLAVNGGGSNVNFLANGTTAAVAGVDYTNVTLTAAADLKAVKVTGTNALALDVTSAVKVTSVDASANTAGINLTTGGQTGALVVTATAAADKIVVGSVGTGGSVSIDAGAGNDAISGLQANIAAATVKGGAGTDTLTFSDTGSVTIADNSFVNVSGVEKIALAATTGLVWTVGGYANAIATANAGVLDITATSLASTGAVTVDGSGLGASNSLKLTLRDTAGTGNITVHQSAGADTIKISTVTSAAGTITIDGGTAALTSTAVKTIDLSGVAFSTGGVSVTTGAGNDIIKGGSVATSITAGKGADVITLLAGHTAVQSLVYAAGDSTQTSMDQITNFNAAASGDTLGLGTTLLSAAQLSSSGWTVTGGIATKTGATVADFLVAATTSGSAGVVAFSDGTNTYVVASEGTAATTDTVVELVGVTGVALTSTALTAGIHLA